MNHIFSVKNQNKLRFFMKFGIQTTLTLCINGTVMQTFLLSAGFDAKQVYIFATIWEIANILTILLSSRIADKGNLIRRSALFTLPSALLFLLYLPLCNSGAASAEMFLYLIIVSVFHSITMGIYTVFEYKLPYYLFLPGEFGSVTAIAGIVSYVFSFLIGELLSNLACIYSYVALMRVTFLCSFVLTIVVVVLQLFQKRLNTLNLKDSSCLKQKEKLPLSKIIKHPSFWQLFLAHILRGIASGTTMVLAVICSENGFEEDVLTRITSVQSIAMLAGCLVTLFILKYFSSRILVALGSVFYLAFLLLLASDQNSFLFGCFLILFGRTWIDNGVADLMVQVVPVEIAGPYNAIRMAIHHGGTLLATMLATMVPIYWLIVITVLSQLIASGIYTWASVLRSNVPILKKKAGE